MKNIGLINKDGGVWLTYVDICKCYKAKKQPHFNSEVATFTLNLGMKGDLKK